MPLQGKITLLREPRALPSATMTVAFQADNLISIIDPCN